MLMDILVMYTTVKLLISKYSVYILILCGDLNTQ